MCNAGRVIGRQYIVDGQVLAGYRIDFEPAKPPEPPKKEKKTGKEKKDKKEIKEQELIAVIGQQGERALVINNKVDEEPKRVHYNLEITLQNKETFFLRIATKSKDEEVLRQIPILTPDGEESIIDFPTKKGITRADLRVKRESFRLTQIEVERLGNSHPKGRIPFEAAKAFVEMIKDSKAKELHKLLAGEELHSQLLQSAYEVVQSPQLSSTVPSLESSSYGIGSYPSLYATTNSSSLSSSSSPHMPPLPGAQTSSASTPVLPIQSSSTSSNTTVSVGTQGAFSSS